MPAAPHADDSAAMLQACSDVVSELIRRHEKGKAVDVRKLCLTCAASNGLSRTPKLVDIIACIPPQWRKRLQPLVTAKPIRSASGISVVAVMCKPHRCPHIAMTGNVCVYWSPPALHIASPHTALPAVQLLSAFSPPPAVLRGLCVAREVRTATSSTPRRPTRGTR